MVFSIAVPSHVLVCVKLKYYRILGQHPFPIYFRAHRTASCFSAASKDSPRQETDVFTNENTKASNITIKQ